MKEWIGKPCRLCVNRNGVDLFYTVNQVLSVTDTHITFLDRFNSPYSLLVCEVSEIKPN